MLPEREKGDMHDCAISQQNCDLETKEHLVQGPKIDVQEPLRFTFHDYHLLRYFLVKEILCGSR
jgi:hypothetical protein